MSCTSPPREVDIAIIGGGLGGLALAAGLHRRGLVAHVFEASSELRKETSTMVGLGPNALAALGDLHPDLPEQIRQRGVLNDHVKAMHFPAGADPITSVRSGGGGQLCTIRWAQVHEALAQVLPPKFVHCNHAATGYDEIWDEQQMDDGTDADGSATATTATASSSPSVRPAHRSVVHFRDQPSVTAKLVVGADGVFSPIRAAMYPNDPGPRYLGHMNWNCLIHNPGGNTVAYAHEPAQLIYASDGVPGESNPCLIVYVSDAGGGYTFWQVRMRYDEVCFTSQLAQPTPTPGKTNGAGDPCTSVTDAGGAANGPAGHSDGGGGSGIRRGRGGQGVPGSKARVIERLQSAGWHWLLPLVEATPESAIFERALYDRAPLDHWASHGGRVVLLGDAAHAMHPGPGQGARSAFEDAHQLALALEAFWPDVPIALERYQQARIHRANRVQSFSSESAGLPAIREASRPAGLSGKETLERFNEFRVWLDQYPDNMSGDPNSMWWKPPTAAAIATAAVDEDAGEGEVDVATAAAAGLDGLPKCVAAARVAAGSDDCDRGRGEGTAREVA